MKNDLNFSLLIVLLFSVIIIFLNGCHLKDPECQEINLQLSENDLERFIPGKNKFWKIINHSTGNAAVYTTKDSSSKIVKNKYLTKDENQRTIACPYKMISSQYLYDYKGNLSFSQEFEYFGKNSRQNLIFYRYDKGYKTYISGLQYDEANDAYYPPTLSDTSLKILLSDERNINFNGIECDRLVKIWTKYNVDTLYFAEKIGVVGYYIKGNRFSVIEFGTK